MTWSRKPNHLKLDYQLVDMLTNLLYVGTQALHAHTAQNEWAIHSSCTNHMAKDASLFSSLDKDDEYNIPLTDDFALDIVRHGDVPCQHGKSLNVYHVPSLSTNILLVSQLTHTRKIIEFWLNWFLVKYLKKDHSVSTKGILDSNEECIILVPYLDPILIRLLLWHR